MRGVRSWAVLGAVAFLGLGGCTTTQLHRMEAEAASDQVDLEKVVSVNAWAHEHGARVMWVNYPQKQPRYDNHSG